MAWYWWVVIAWVLSGLVALGLEFRDKPAMRENIGWAEVWPVILGPLWLMIKLWQLLRPSKVEAVLLCGNSALRKGGVA